ncbi:hypothetical protein [Campylobacter iguaniorum]|uniref:hypothetical protein n=1 Tax=Campylobacter iguaniorum TaxID=1244531 RepID=UPI0007C89977|nr:hypothetical protein [Campylobacter iguaniorum]
MQVADESLYTGAEVTGVKKLLLITDENDIGYEFVGKALNQGGLWQTNAPTFFKEGNKWYLANFTKEANNDTTAILSDRQVAIYNQWNRISNDSLRKRLGDLRYDDSKQGSWAVWLTLEYGKTIRFENNSFIEPLAQISNQKTTLLIEIRL